MEPDNDILARSERVKLTPPEIGRLWGIDPIKVLGWIKSGELRAINAATKRGGRPRYLIDREDLADFERSRAVSPPPPKPARKRKPAGNVKQYF